VTETVLEHASYLDAGGNQQRVEGGRGHESHALGHLSNRRSPTGARASVDVLSAEGAKEREERFLHGQGGERGWMFFTGLRVVRVAFRLARYGPGSTRSLARQSWMPALYLLRAAVLLRRRGWQIAGTAHQYKALYLLIRHIIIQRARSSQHRR
jgi:hypothetical protein